MERLEELQKLLNTPQKIVITCHQKPDADALGSSLGLANYLKKKNHTVQVVVPTDYPEFLFWMSGHSEVLIHNPHRPARSKEAFAEADMIFCLDFSVPNRAAPLDEYINSANVPIVLLDHHHGKTDFATFELWNPQAAATAELVIEFIELLGDKNLIDKDIASALYAGIMTDTGSFKHSGTSPRVHRIAADLMEIGIDTARIHRDVYDTSSPDRLRFLGYCLQEKLQILPQYQTAYFAISAEELRQFNHKTGDTEGIVNYALSIEGVRMSAFIVERTGCVKISFRSFGSFPVNEFARLHFNGGGHRNAAGGRVEISLEESVKRFLNLLPQYEEALNADA